MLAPRGKAAGVTARFVLRFRTTGDVTKTVTVSGRLFLTQSAGGAWQIFGYDVAKGSQVMRRRIGRITKLVTLALVLGVVALTVPDSAVKPTEMTLVKVDDAQATAHRARRDLHPGRRLGRAARRGHDPHPR